MLILCSTEPLNSPSALLQLKIVREQRQKQEEKLALLELRRVVEQMQHIETDRPAQEAEVRFIFQYLTSLSFALSLTYNFHFFPLSSLDCGGCGQAG